MANRLVALKREKESLVNRMRATLDLAETEKRELTEEEAAEYGGHEKNLGQLDLKIAREQRLQELERTMKLGPDDDRTEEHGMRVGNVREAWAKDPKRGFASPREFLVAVMHAGRTGEIRDDRLKSLVTAGSDEQGGYSDPYGGFFVPVGMSPTLLQLAPEDDPIGARVTQIPMTAPTVKFNARCDKDHSSSVSGGLTVMRRAETQTQSATRAVYEQVTLEATALFGLAYATEEILSDSPVSFAAMLQAGFRDQFTSHLIDERLNGTGVGEFMGVMQSPCLVSIAKETGQDADSIVYENLIKMRARCWRYSDAVWLYNHDCLPQLMTLVMPIGTGGVPLWQVSARDGQPDTILGRPAVPSEYCKTLGDKGDLVLGVWSEFLEGTYERQQSAESIHVRFVNHERTFKFWLRNAGAPWWRAALTPKNSTSTLSPFVTLNARA